ncbi:MAG: hypothetical protein KAW88_04830 [Candidatus Cloacimonetes bacterium]|nr:hypothetical protein [Candidatus Cloacimonadota bacterium]
MYLIKNVLASISRKIDLKYYISKKLNLSLNTIDNIKILRRSIDARKKNNLKYNFTISASIHGKIPQHPDITEYKPPEPYLESKKQIFDLHPFIIGAGPAGLFAALSLVEKGFKPYIFDRGDEIEKRTKKVTKFWEKGLLDEESNVQFGEGGAGTFSDGKLTTRTRDFYTEKIIDYLVKFGADKKIKYEALPHLGTDGIKKIVINIRNFLEEKGCKFFWKHKLQDIQIQNGKIASVNINKQTYNPEILILAIGNSARDTFEMLSQKISLENKPFAVGVRIEHLQDYINQAFYGEKTDFTITGPASYRLTAKSKNRGIYSFCMCPGGYIIPASSEKDSLVLNGMSFKDRNNKYANSAIVVTVNESDYGKQILAGIEFQRKIERKCFLPKNPYFAPVQKVNDFLKGKTSENKIRSSYVPGILPKKLNELLPEQISKNLKFGLKIFDKRIPGFIKEGILLAPETRTSSPIRILRNKETFEALEVSNLYPIGEGSGYSGGIISSAVDGYKLGQIFKF